MDDNWWNELRWRISLQFLLWGMKTAPDGDAKGSLIDHHLEWIARCKKQWRLRYPGTEN